MSVPDWSGDAGSLQFQTLAYNSTINSLSLNPFGNTVTLNAPALSNISSINGTPLPTCQVIPLSNYQPTIPPSNSSVAIVTFSNLVPNNFYRCSFSAAFANGNGTPNSNGYITLGGYGSGSPSDAEDIASINCLDFISNPGNLPGNAGANAGNYGCVFAPYTSTWTIYGSSGTNTNLPVTMNLTKMYLEKML